MDLLIVQCVWRISGLKTTYKCPCPLIICVLWKDHSSVFASHPLSPTNHLDEGRLICSWPKVEGDELFSSHYMHMQFNTLSDFAESLKLITYVVFLFRVTENCKSLLSKKMNNICLSTDIQECRFELVQHSPFSPDVAPSDCYLFPKMKRKLSGRHFSSDDDIITAVDLILLLQRKDMYALQPLVWFNR